MKFYTIELIKGVLRFHPSECVFELDAPAKILKRIQEQGLEDCNPFSNYTQEYNEPQTEKLKACFVQSEIYCPHEGIDRLAECGVKSLDWELA